MLECVLEATISEHCEERKFRGTILFGEWKEELHRGIEKEAIVEQEKVWDLSKLSKESKLGVLNLKFLCNCPVHDWLIELCWMFLWFSTSFWNFSRNCLVVMKTCQAT